MKQRPRDVTQKRFRFNRTSHCGDICIFRSKIHENPVFRQPRPGNARRSSAEWLKVKQGPRDVRKKRFRINRSSHRGDICIFRSKIHEKTVFHQPRPGNARGSSAEWLRVKQGPRDVTQKKFSSIGPRIVEIFAFLESEFHQP